MEIYQPDSHDDWLNFRRQRLTSTELAGLHLRKTATAWNELRTAKETGDNNFHGNAYTIWGSEREPLLAPAVTKIDTRLVYNENPQKIFVNPLDNFLCCTPDLYSEDGEVIGEIKTSGKQFEGGTYHEWCPDQYYCQVQLNMEYTGADACVLLVEYRDDTPDGFTPRSIEYRVIGYDKATIDALLNTAEEWKAWLNGTTPEWMGSVDGLDDADELAEAVQGFIDADAKAKSWADVAKVYKGEIDRIVGGSYQGEIAGHVLSVSVLGPSKTFDSKAFKKAHPDLYEEYRTKERAGYTRITIKETE